MIDPDFDLYYTILAFVAIMYGIGCAAVMIMIDSHTRINMYVKRWIGVVSAAVAVVLAIVVFTQYDCNLLYTFTVKSVVSNVALLTSVIMAQLVASSTGSQQTLAGWLEDRKHDMRSQLNESDAGAAKHEAEQQMLDDTKEVEQHASTY